MEELFDLLDKLTFSNLKYAFNVSLITIKGYCLKLPNSVDTRIDIPRV
jgi:hypothetical protein